MFPSFANNVPSNFRRTALLALALLGCNASLAEQRIEEITVTASHYPLASNQAAAAVSVIDQYQIDNRAALSMLDLLRDVPGMAVSQSGVLGSMSEIRVRGAEANQLLVLIDGIEVNDPSQNDGLNWGTLSAADIERIEVIRGSQSALYGSDAMAGVVNIITRSSDSPLSAGFSLERGGNVTWQRGLNVGVAGDKFSLRLAANKLESDGENIALEGDELDGHNNTTYGLKGRWQPSDNWRVGFSARRSEGSSDFDEPDDNTGLMKDAPSYSDFMNSNVGVTIDHDSQSGISQRVKWAMTETQNDNFAVWSDSTMAEKEQLQYLLSFASSTGRATLLLERETEQFDRKGVNTGQERETDSLGVELRQTFFDALTFAASGRFDDNSAFDDSSNVRFETSYQLDEQWRMRGSYSTADKNPTFVELYGYSPDGYIGNPDLQPESSETTELGLDWNAPDNRIGLNLTVFDMSLSDEIYTVYAPNTSLNREGESRRRGAELGFSWLLDDALSLDGSYSYIKSTELKNGARVDELRRPNHLASVTLDWQINEQLQASVNFQHSGRQTDQDFYSSGQPLVEFDAFTLLAINVNYQASDELVLYAKATNAGDVHYQEVFGYSTPSRQIAVGVRYQWAR